MKILQQSRLLGLAIAFAAVSTPVLAHECNELSELRTESGDGYFELSYDGERDRNSTARETRSRAERYEAPEELDMLRDARYRNGTGTRHICTGSESNPVIETSEFDIEEYRVSDFINGDVVVRVLEDSESMARKATMEFPAGSRWSRVSNRIVSHSRLYRQYINFNNPRHDLQNFRFSSFSAAGDHFIPRPSYLAEVQTTIERVGKGLRMTQSIFRNGHKVEWVVWELNS